jgi:hypothetical protein
MAEVKRAERDSLREKKKKKKNLTPMTANSFHEKNVLTHS